MIYRVYLASIVIGITLLIHSCSLFDHSDDECAYETPWVLPPSIKVIPDTLQVGGKNFVLICYLYRDFQPISPPDGKPLIAIIRLTEVDSIPITINLELTHLWITYNSQYWSTTFTNEQGAPTPDYQKEKVARCGPKWGPGVTVDVMCKLIYNRETILYLKSSNVLIGRTD